MTAGPHYTESSSKLPAAARTPLPGRLDGRRGATGIDWSPWVRRVERQRRTLLRRQVPRRRMYPSEFFALITYASFRLDGLDLSRSEVAGALAHGPSRKAFRTRQAQRVRNHVAIVRAIERDLMRCAPVTADTVVRWYTSISSGLSTTALAQAPLDRLVEVIRRVNTPHVRLQSALQEVAHEHVRLLSDPLVPSFNGILARLLLHYHLGRCGLPGVIFDPGEDASRLTDQRMLLTRLMELVDQSYGMLLKNEG